MPDAKVVFIHGVSQPVLKAITSLNPEGFVTIPVEGKTTPEEKQIEAVKDADFIMWFSARMTDRVLRSATKTRLVQGLSAGYDSVNLKLLRELNIPCANNGGANSWAVADHAVLAMLTLYRRMPAADRATREGRWREAIDGTNTFEMANKVVGVMGFGNIGQKVARRVQAFDATVQYYDKFPLKPEREQELKVKRVSLEELFRTSDIITCHAPLTNDTRNVVNRQRLGTMKPRRYSSTRAAAKWSTKRRSTRRSRTSASPAPDSTFSRRSLWTPAIHSSSWRTWSCHPTAPEPRGTPGSAAPSSPTRT